MSGMFSSPKAKTLSVYLLIDIIPDFKGFKLLFGDDHFDSADKATVMEATLAAPANRFFEVFELLTMHTCECAVF